MFGKSGYCFELFFVVQWSHRRGEGGCTVPEDRLDQVYNMVSSLIQIVGHTNSIVQDLRMDISGLKTGQDELRKDVNGLKTGQDELRKDVNGLKTGQDELRKDVNDLKTGQDELRKDVNGLKTGQDELRKGQEQIKTDVARIEQKVDRLTENQAGIFEMLGDHDVAIRALRKRERVG